MGANVGACDGVGVGSGVGRGDGTRLGAVAVTDGAVKCPEARSCVCHFRCQRCLLLFNLNIARICATCTVICTGVARRYTRCGMYAANAIAGRDKRSRPPEAARGVFGAAACEVWWENKWQCGPGTLALC